MCASSSTSWSCRTSASIDAQRREFVERGILVFEPALPDELLDGVLADVAPLYDPASPVETHLPFRSPDRVQDAWKVSPKVRAVARAPAVLELLAALYERAPLPFQTLNFPVGTQQHVHADTVHFNSDPAGFMCGVWVALEDMDMANGPLVYYPGSHMMPEVDVDMLEERGYLELRVHERLVASVLLRLKGRVPAWWQHRVYASYETFVGDLLEGVDVEPEYGLLRRGQALIWASNILHGGSPQRDPARTRHSQVTHYFFEGCRYYTPVLSKGRHTQWREPVWIR